MYLLPIRHEVACYTFCGADLLRVFFFSEILFVDVLRVMTHIGEGVIGLLLLALGIDGNRGTIANETYMLFFSRRPSGGRPGRNI